jgi:pimeloyl-ACP methyl ester carboxylesterase
MIFGRPLSEGMTMSVRLICQVALLAACPLISMNAVAAEAAPPPSPNLSLDVYAKPARLVDIGGRKLNLRCTGKGSPTVMLEAGATIDSITWYKLQPLVAKFATVCSYDRAGFGFSDEGPMPRGLDAEADDLHALIHAGGMKTPLLLVGHSRGTNIARRYADKYAADLSALVLLDPPGQHLAEFAPAMAKEEEQERFGGIAAMKKCETGAEKNQLDKPPAELAKCLRGPNPEYSATLNAAQHAIKLRPSFWRTLISVYETNSLYDEQVSSKENHGALPLLVLTPDSPFEDAPPEARKALGDEREKTQKLILATSTRSERILVAHSSHDVQLDQPEAVVDAIRKAARLGGDAPKKNETTGTRRQK